MGCGGSKDDKGGADGGSSTTAATGNVSHDETKALFNLVSKGNPNIYKTQVEEWYERVHPSKDNKEKDALRERVASTFMDMTGAANASSAGLGRWREWMAELRKEKGEGEFRKWFNEHNH
eukprot:TRINITY_DN1343_c0_g1_i1.p1 TRINITY_DN1343_c0_g1~~TRINITY_DN1343_c0_g1_i1.p1  ORF type:complete len:120 (-),score=36.64 TRINITY_DN1343_c0_g1_i1:205-564(-)